MDVAKTPINVLKTICAKRNWNVDYNMISEEGRVHEPTFTFRVFIEEVALSAIASGFSKKKAKQAAALKALQILADTDEEVEFELDSLEEHMPIEPEVSAVTDKSNPVGKLQEVCMRKKWSPPVYLTDEEDGPPHCKVFTITCKLENMGLESQGHDKSKKGGKKLAAHEMLKLLESRGLYNSQLDSVKGGKNAVVFQPDDSKADQIVTFYRAVDDPLQRKLDEIIAIIDSPSDDSNYVEALEKVCGLLFVKTKYIDFKSPKGRYHVLVSLRSSSEKMKRLPILTGWGINEDLTKAKQRAAFIALTLLDQVRYL